MSNKNKKHTKRWLITRLKTSGSKSAWSYSPDYSGDRHSKQNRDWDNSAFYSRMGKSSHYYSGKINYSILVRFLRGQVGNNWDNVHDEYLSRIPTNLHEYEECIHWFVADKVEVHGDLLWDRRSQYYVRTKAAHTALYPNYTNKEFYVDPETNILIRIPDFPSNRKTKGMTREQLRKFREKQKRGKLKAKKREQREELYKEKWSKELLSMPRQD